MFQLTGHLVYWAKAIVIYPLCEGNVYVLAHGAHIPQHESLISEFNKEFPGSCLLQVSFMQFRISSINNTNNAYLQLDHVLKSLIIVDNVSFIIMFQLDSKFISLIFCIY